MLGEGLVSEHKPRWAAFGSTSRTPKNHIPGGTFLPLRVQG